MTAFGCRQKLDWGEVRFSPSENCRAELVGEGHHQGREPWE
jgi:hypothetical protein